MALLEQKVLLVASAGGHWVQLRRVVRAFEGAQLSYVTTDPGYRDEVGDAPFYIVRDANRRKPLECIQLAMQLAHILLSERPQVVFSTGAAPGCLAILFGRLLGARTIWLDSIANVDRLSLSARLILPFAGLVLTQWPTLQTKSVEYAGAVL